MVTKAHIEPATGKLGVLLPGMGAVATTLIAGVLAARKGLALPIGSLTQLGHARLGKRTEQRNPMIKELVPLSDLEDLVFGGWDPYSDDAYTAATKAGVLDTRQLESVGQELRAIKPMSAAFSPEWVSRLDDVDHAKAWGSRRSLLEQLGEDIDRFRSDNQCERLVMIHCGSTEAHVELSPAHQSLDAFEQGLDRNDPTISPTQLYAYAAIRAGVPFANGTPNLGAGVPALVELANQDGVPVAGKDFKTGQTLMKTIIAPGLKARLLGISGWFSTNILGNRDGEVLDDPDNFRAKEVTKLGVLEQILQPDLYPELYGDVYHKVRINYYPPKGDDKEGWDTIDVRGWLGYPMQVKINFLAKDSILAAPLALDLALFLDLASRAGKRGIQEWLSFYFKSPLHGAELYPENDLFIQLTKLKNNLRHLAGEELITHLGTEYYE